MDTLELRRVLFLLAAYFFTIITALTQLTQDAFILVFASWLIAFCAVVAAAADARLLGKPIPLIIQFVMLLAWPIAVPVSLVWHRRWVGLLLAVVCMTALFATYYFPYVVAYYLVTIP